MDVVLRLLDLLRLSLLVVYKVLTMSYEGFVGIMLTALGVMLAILTIIIAVLALFGNAGFKDWVKDAVAKAVDPIMEKKLKEYPDAAQYIVLYRDMQDRLAAWDGIQNTIVSQPASASSSKPSNTPEETKEPKESAETPVTPYPGEEQQNVNAGTAAPAASVPATTNAGTDHPESPESGSS
ncbi:MAG: hypothetical protein ACRD51_15465 [Candidatus Acidiferrum sp.]